MTTPEPDPTVTESTADTDTDTDLTAARTAELLREATQLAEAVRAHLTETAETERSPR
ncbi:hypothetical protein [Streptomyces sp. MP131-18]|uniref:hypothetical protein n=1 Tax=Streptomyces sp. MP131-18 TaxID=1857892 RepID=UPI0009C730B9|nr:hypothetical protein [Streptomyces sp. MP131-18]ONK14057.1 hypothetical protein STBA_48360 [Streptomyces sp. MP131-18]